MLRNIFLKNLPTVKKGLRTPKRIVPTTTHELDVQSLRNILSGIRAMRKERPKR